ncbi:MAG: hypothetical protein ACLPR9_06170 [Acidimicrobiales bacterium]
MNRITNKKENSDTTTLHRHSHRRARPHGPDRLQFELDAVDHGGRTPTARRHLPPHHRGGQRIGGDR